MMNDRNQCFIINLEKAEEIRFRFVFVFFVDQTENKRKQFHGEIELLVFVRNRNF